MSLLTTLPRGTPLRSLRSLSTSAPRLAEAAPAAIPRYVRKTAAPAKGGYKTASASTAAKAVPVYPKYTRPTAAAAKAAAPPVAEAAPESFPDMPVEETLIGDYANLAPPTAAPSPPLTSLPDQSYQPLPSVATPENLGLGQGNRIPGEAAVGQDWSTSFAGLSDEPFSRETAEALLRELKPDDVEIKPDGLLYLPEIKYRRTLNLAFGPGGWGLAPRGETHVGPRIVSREWGLVCLGRLVSVARGEQEYFDPSGIATATEACKSNALMRCCKDLGIASELWDPSFIRKFKKDHCIEVFAEHATKKGSKKKLWRKKNAPKFEYPYKE
ncbi:hypothetical protein I350_07177 [Cryptococcus amylolentus CBS 6273]|uniref:Mitochondrial genome maintenance protein MGM101 n=1 Tax=Cryptococcus amylolentus CBS 6273 TaxID=1296118 RepID=A0A1E3JEC5_9TREE|nr:hypothetical protein I350_07177 [Cryptococcus amylolentus CBS 6273]